MELHGNFFCSVYSVPNIFNCYFFEFIILSLFSVFFVRLC